MKEIKDDINRWRDIPCSGVGRINIVKITVVPNTIQHVFIRDNVKCRIQSITDLPEPDSPTIAKVSPL